MITVDDFVVFCSRTIDGMRRAVSGLSDTEVVRRPALDGANSPYALVTHALGAAEWWTLHVVLGRHVDRDRDAEFTATGTVDELIRRCDRVEALIVDLAPELASARRLGGRAVTRRPLPVPWTVGAALLHTYEELAQHLGHLEITVDLVRAPPRPAHSENERGQSSARSTAVDPPSTTNIDPQA